MTTPDNKSRLRLITYLTPGLPVETYQIFTEYLESVLGVHGTLIYEWRWSGPPPNRVDPFTADEVDIGFFCSSSLLQLQQQKNEHIKLCQAAPLYQHTNALNRPVYFSDVIVHASNASKYKTFHDLKGCHWAYNEGISLSGNLVVLQELKRQGFNANFFADVKETGGHLRSIDLVLNQTVDAAAIDSNTLTAFGKQYPEKREQLSVVTSLGPMPIYPIVFNSRMPGELQQKITQAFLDMTKSPEWKEKLKSINISGFAPIDMSLYNMETEIADLVKNMKINAAYY